MNLNERQQHLLRIPWDVLEASPDLLAERKTLEAELEAARKAQADHVNRIGQKINILRQGMLPEKGLEFFSYRFAGDPRYEHTVYGPIPAEAVQIPGFKPGGIYCQDEGRKEAFVDQLLALEGLLGQ